MCTDPVGNGHRARWPATALPGHGGGEEASEAEREAAAAERRATIENNKAMAAANETRREWIKGLLLRKTAPMARMILTHLDAISAMVGGLYARIDAQLAPTPPRSSCWTPSTAWTSRRPGDHRRDRHRHGRFPAPAHLASWAWVCPGNNKTAGKPKSAATRPGNRWLKVALGTAALGAIRKKDSYLHVLYRRIAVRRGGKRALAAVAHSQLVTIWHVLSSQTAYQDLSGDNFLRRDNPEHRRRRAVDQLERLGDRVILEPAA